MKTPGLIRAATEALCSLFFPSNCAVCLAPTKEGETLCSGCSAAATRIDAPYCQKCSQPFSGTLTTEFLCDRCLSSRVYFQCAIARYRSRGVVRELIHRFKYGHEFQLRHQLGCWLAEAYGDERVSTSAPDVLVPVPLHATRKREREYNQSEELAKLLSKATGIGVANSLRRKRATPTQTHLNRAQRMENLRNAFEIRKNERVSGLHVLLIDDVFTTGSTVAECSRVLRNAQAASVRVLTVARG